MSVTPRQLVNYEGMRSFPMTNEEVLTRNFPADGNFPSTILRGQVTNLLNVYGAMNGNSEHYKKRDGKPNTLWFCGNSLCCGEWKIRFDGKAGKTLSTNPCTCSKEELPRTNAYNLGGTIAGDSLEKTKQLLLLHFFKEQRAAIVHCRSTSPAGFDNRALTHALLDKNLWYRPFRDRHDEREHNRENAPASKRSRHEEKCFYCMLADGRWFGIKVSISQDTGKWEPRAVPEASRVAKHLMPVRAVVIDVDRAPNNGMPPPLITSRADAFVNRDEEDAKKPAAVGPTPTAKPPEEDTCMLCWDATEQIRLLCARPGCKGGRICFPCANKYPRMQTRDDIFLWFLKRSSMKCLYCRNMDVKGYQVISNEEPLQELPIPLPLGFVGTHRPFQSLDELYRVSMAFDLVVLPFWQDLKQCKQEQRDAKDEYSSRELNNPTDPHLNTLRQKIRSLEEEEALFCFPDWAKDWAGSKPVPFQELVHWPFKSKAALGNYLDDFDRGYNPRRPAQHGPGYAPDGFSAWGTVDPRAARPVLEAYKRVEMAFDAPLETSSPANRQSISATSSGDTSNSANDPDYAPEVDSP